MIAALSHDLTIRARPAAPRSRSPARARPARRRSGRRSAACASHAISATITASTISASKPRPKCRPRTRTRKPITAAAATTSPGGRPASNDKPSLRAGGSNSIKAGMVARAAACDAISAHTTAWRVGQARQRADAQDKRHRQSANAVNADAAVAHDGEFLLAGMAAAETVGGIGEAVFVQAAGREHRGGDAERRRRPWRQSAVDARAIDDRADETDESSRDRKRPGRTGQRIAGKRRCARAAASGCKTRCSP